MSYPIVSIVTPSFNQGRFLEHAIQSVIHQNYSRLEYIIIDGGSTDGSVDIIRRYESQLAYWVSEKDAGQAQAINKGFLHASGEIFAWLNSDDLYLPNAIARAVSFLEQNPDLGFVYGDAITIDEQGRPLHRLSFDDWDVDDFRSFRMICQPAVFFRRQAWEAVGGIDESYHYMLDHDLWQRMASRFSAAYSREMWAAARHHQQAKNVQQASSFSREIDRLMSEILQTHGDSLSIRQRKRIKGGSYRLQGRYYLDGGNPRAALRAYAHALWYSPRYALQHKHRMIFALFMLAGMESLINIWRERREKRRRSEAVRSVSRVLERNSQPVWYGIQLPNGEIKA